VTRPYSFLRHLGKLVFFGDFRDSFPMAMFSSYFDASGKKTGRVFTVAGFVGRVTKWDRFNNEWSEILSSEQVSAMHMTDFASSEEEFKSWRGQSDRRRQFISRFPSTLVVNDYHEVNTEYFLLQYFAATTRHDASTNFPPRSKMPTTAVLSFPPVPVMGAAAFALHKDKPVPVVIAYSVA
jgi:hypothetical protein